MVHILDQIEFLQSKCERNKIALKLIWSEFDERNAMLVASSFLSQIAHYETIITSLGEHNRIKKHK